MKECANCRSLNPEEASICHACESRAFVNSTRVIEDALKRIKVAWVVGAFSVMITLVISLLPFCGISMAGFNTSGALLNILGALFMGALVFGVYRKSRICAALLFGSFLFWKVVLFLKYGFVGSGTLGGLIFLFGFIQGIRGTFEWHRLKSEQRDKLL